MEAVTGREEIEHTVDISLSMTSMMWKDIAGGLHDESLGLQALLQEEVIDGFDALPQRIYLPMEHLLLRHIQLPLQKPYMVDADMMFQELANSCDVAEDDWWLSWDLRSCDAGIAGMLFALPEAWRTAIQSHEKLRLARYVLVDGYERLSARLTDHIASLVLDQDAEGIFFGVFDGQTWQGMRRINGDMTATVYEEIRLSSIAMGFDWQSGCVQGCIGHDLLQMLLADGLHWQGDEVEVLPSRHAANLHIAQYHHAALNLRHGAWALRRDWGFLKTWKRSMVLCGFLLLAWMVSTMIDIYRLDHAIEAGQQRIESAFHAGLPDEPVMLDPLAQLKQAAGGSDVHDEAFLSSLQAVSRVYKAIPWQLHSLTLRDGVMLIAGEVSDINTLNKIQAELKKRLQRDVQIADTNMRGNQISFRMQW